MRTMLLLSLCLVACGSSDPIDYFPVHHTGAGDAGSDAPDAPPCCTKDPNVHVGQTKFFSHDNLCGTWDYDCDGVEEFERSDTSRCQPGGGSGCVTLDTPIPDPKCGIYFADTACTAGCTPNVTYTQMRCR